MEAGHELDVLVAERLGLKWDSKYKYWNFPDGTYAYGEPFLPDYSTSIAAAWELVPRVDSYRFSITRQDGQWFASFDAQEKDSQFYPRTWSMGWGKADTAPLAICLAFLKATEPA